MCVKTVSSNETFGYIGCQGKMSAQCHQLQWDAISAVLTFWLTFTLCQYNVMTLLNNLSGTGGWMICCPNARGCVRNRKSNPECVSPRDLTYCSHKPECIGTTNPDRSVLITIITWHFQFHPVNVSNLHVKGVYVLEATAVSRAPPSVASRDAP